MKGASVLDGMIPTHTSETFYLTSLMIELVIHNHQGTTSGQIM